MCGSCKADAGKTENNQTVFSWTLVYFCVLFLTTTAVRHFGTLMFTKLTYFAIYHNKFYQKEMLHCMCMVCVNEWSKLNRAWNPLDFMAVLSGRRFSRSIIQTLMPF